MVRRRVHGAEHGHGDAAVSVARMGGDRIPPMRPSVPFLTATLVLGLPHAASSQARLQSSDLLKLRSVTAVELSPDGTRAAYVVDNNDGPGRPYGQLWVTTLPDGKSVRFGADQESSGDPQWSPDGQW